MRIALFILFSFPAFGFEILAAKRLDSDVFIQYNRKILIENYQKLGIKAKVTYLPENEINQRIKNGEFDALAGKLTADEVIANSIKIDPPIVKNYTVHLFKFKSNITKKTKLTVGALKGVLGHQKALIKNRIKFNKVVYAQSFNELYLLLKNKQVDVIMLTQVEFDLQFSKVQAFNMAKHSSDIYSTQINHYLHKKHKKIVKKIEARFEDLAQKNELDFDDFLIRYFN